MNKPVGNVSVSINATMEAGFNQAFNTADKRMVSLGKTASDLSRKVGDISAYRKQENALKQAGSAYLEAKKKAAALRAEIAASENPTRKQQAALQKAETAAKRAGGAYTDARNRLADMRRELERNGVQVGKLSSEYRRLQTELAKTKTKYGEHEASLKRQQQFVQSISNGWNKIQGFVVGAAAAAAVMSRPISQAMNWQERVARLADTAGAGKSAAEKRAIQAQLSAAVTSAQKSGGGRRDDIAGGLDTLIGTGGLGANEAAGMLPSIARAAFASNTPAEQVAAIALKMKQFGVRDTAAGLDIVMRGGQAGGVEMKHMAEMLPEQMAAARAAGYSGEQGLAQIVAMNQLALRTAGNPMQAANNVQNLLNKLVTPELSKNVTKATGVDFEAYKVKQREKGVYAAEAFAQLADKDMAKDRGYQKLKARLAKSKDDGERSAILSDMAGIMEGSQMGQFIQDKQALAAALAMMYARKDIDPTTGKSAAQSMVEQVASGAGGVAGSSDFLRSQTFAKSIDAGEAVNRANEGAFEAVAGPLGAVMQGATALADMFPKLTSAAYAAATALAAIAAGGIVSGVLRRTSGAGAATAAGGAAATVAGGSASGAMGAAARLAGPVAMVTALANTTTGEEDEELTNGPTRWAALRSKYGQETIDAARKKYQPWYQMGRGYAADNEKWVEQYMASGGGGGSSSTVVEAAKTAADAAKASAQRPNVTMNNNISLSVSTFPGASNDELVAKMKGMLDESLRKAETEKRSIMMDNAGY